MTFLVTLFVQITKNCQRSILQYVYIYIHHESKWNTKKKKCHEESQYINLLSNRFSREKVANNVIELYI